MIWLVLLVMLTWSKNVSDGANILVILPTPSFSHQQFYRVYVKALRERGHNLTVVTPNPLNDRTSTNYREVDLSYLYEEFNQVLNGSSEVTKVNRVMTELLFVVYAKLILKTCVRMLADRNLIDIYRRDEKFHLFIAEWGMHTCFLPFERLAEGRMIGISSFAQGALSQNQLGGVWSPAFAADPSLEYSDRMTFFQRMRSTTFYWTSFLFVELLRRYETNLARQHFGPDIESTLQLQSKVALVLDNSHVAFNYPRANNINVIPLGGPAFHLNGRKRQALPKELKDFLDDAPNGVIYFSLGTNVKTGNFSKEVEDILAESFRQVKQKVLWKWENPNVKVNNPNVRLSRWFPQIDVLAHPNVKAFVTQGGLQSIGEAIEYQVPMVVIPFFADQNHNARKMEMEGVAVNLNFDLLSVDMFTRALNDVLYDSKYKENIVRFSALVKDQPIPPLEKAIWWTEYVIRHNGAPHLRSAAATMPWYQYFMLDVLGAIFLVVFLILYVVYSTVRVVVRWLTKAKRD